MKELGRFWEIRDVRVVRGRGHWQGISDIGGGRDRLPHLFQKRKIFGVRIFPVVVGEAGGS
jgi:hypothetical protein